MARKKQAKRFLKMSGLSFSVGSTYLKDKVFGVFQKKSPEEETLMHSEAAQKIAETLGEMKGTVMKFGQMLSTSSELFPPEFTEALAPLQKQATPVSYRVIREQIETEMQGKLRELFPFFQAHPLAAASIGQVHLARLPDGREVVVKVQYPGVDEDVEGDLQNIKFLLGSLKKVFGAHFDMTHLMGEIRDRFIEELDYQHELKNIHYFRELYAGHEAVVIPKPLDELCTKRILILEHIPGIPLGDFASGEASQEERNQVGGHLVEFYFQQLFRHHVLHADPHPGNFAVTREGRLAVYDFGCVKHFPEKFMSAYIDILRECMAGKTTDILAGMQRMGVTLIKDMEFPSNFFPAYAEMFLAPFYSDSYDFGEAKIQDQVLRRAATEMKYVTNFKPPPEVVFHNRVLVGAYQSLRNLRAQGDWQNILMPFLR